MGTSDNNHLPDLGKTFVAILEHYTTKVIGDSAKDELKKPHERKELREQLEKVFVYTEQRFIIEFDDRELCEAIINLPIADLPSLVTAVYEFYERPTDTQLEYLLADKTTAYGSECREKVLP